MDLYQDAPEGLAKLHGFLGGERERHLNYFGVGEVAERSRAAVALWQHNRQAELNPAYILDDEQGQDHGVPPLTHFIHFFPQ